MGWIIGRGIGVPFRLGGSGVKMTLGEYLIRYDGNTSAWYVADDESTITKDGSNYVSIWKDRLGSGRDLKQSVGTCQPLWDANGYIIFDGTDNTLVFEPYNNAQPLMIYLIYKHPAWATLSYIFELTAGVAPNYAWFRQYVSTPRLYPSAGTPSIYFNLNNDTWAVIRILFNGASSKAILDNGIALTGDLGATGSSRLSVANNYGGSRFANIVLKELLIRTVSEDSDDETAIYNYLNARKP